MVKVSPDEDTPAQIAGVCAAVAAAGVDGIIVGNTTLRRPRAVMDAASTTDGVTIHRTDDKDAVAATAAAPKLSAEESRTLMNETGGLSGPMLFERTAALVREYRRTLDRFTSEGSKPGKGKGAADTQTDTEGKGTRSERKVIFATGGITTGEQAAAVLEAGADVVQVYTALVYGGVGTVGRIKSELGDVRRRKQRG